MSLFSSVMGNQKDCLSAFARKNPKRCTIHFFVGMQRDRGIRIAQAEIIIGA